MDRKTTSTGNMSFMSLTHALTVFCGRMVESFGNYDDDDFIDDEGQCDYFAAIREMFGYNKRR